MEEMKTKKLYDIDAYATEFEGTVLLCEEVVSEDEEGTQKV